MPHRTTAESCLEKHFCQGAATGKCSYAKIVDGQADYFDDPKLAQHFTRRSFATFLRDTTRQVLPGCAQPDQLREAIERARTKAADYFSRIARR